MATIKDIAKKAGVSVGTVSNMINGKTVVSEEKYEKIKKAMEELNYKTNYMAKNLKMQKNIVIGIILPSLDEPYSDIYEGIADLLDIRDYITVLKLTQNNIVLENQFLEQLVGMGVIGLIIVPSDVNNYQKYKEIQNQGVALVFIERKIGSIDVSNVLFENKKIIYKITKDILAENSGKNIKLIVGRQDFTNEKDCIEGYTTARSNHEDDIIIINETKREALFNQLYGEIIAFDKVPDCIITSSIEFAKITLEVCNILHYNIEIHAIVGEKWYTTDLYKKINQYGRNAILLGKKAAKLLIELIGNKHLAENKTIYIESKKKYRTADVAKSYNNGTKIRILAFQSDMVNAMEKLSYSFTNVTGIKFEFDKRNYTELRSELTRQVEQQLSDYDLVMIDIPWLRSILGKNYLANMLPKVREDKLLNCYPSSVKNAFYKGDTGTHIFPIIATVQTLLYRKDIFSDRDIKVQFFKKYGYELEPPKTWTNFNIIAEFFDRRENPKSPFEYGTAATSLEPVGLINEFLPRQWAFHGKIIDQWGSLVIDSEENVRALENLVKTFEHAPKETAHYFWDEIFELLIKGEIPIAQGFAAHYQPGKYSHHGNTYEKYIGGTRLPSGKTMLGGWALGINKNSSNISACYDFIKWNLSDTAAISTMRLCGCIPTVSVFQDETLKGSYNWLKLIDEKCNMGGLREEIYNFEGQPVDLETVDQLLSKGIKKAIYKEIDVVTALSEVKEDLSIILGKKRV
ncbi:extracellular solute-binding protein [Cellulosilyticum sp. I15G10I2]|uniref:extracellular solute-binding protein n=1 Tax=Cellulosilyticum sp. I15G10I2 TaxID=1892843 RepID=UPI00085CC046|nr:extracellular solute-binding protein [Cellulosilyticum sp. I15G10I2]